MCQINTESMKKQVGCIDVLSKNIVIYFMVIIVVVALLLILMQIRVNLANLANLLTLILLLQEALHLSSHKQT